jgi:hypothetical protein
MKAQSIAGQRTEGVLGPFVELKHSEKLFFVMEGGKCPCILLDMYIDCLKFLCSSSNFIE